MAVSKKLSVGLTSLAVVTALAIGGSSMVFAEDATNGQSLAERIATKFNLNKDEVQAVFEEDQAARQAERLAEVSQDLQTAVDAGELTTDQKTLIENKIKENQAARKAEMDSIQAWAEENNIDMRLVMGGGRHRGDSNRLQDAVDSGSITAEQKALIEAKQSELETARDAAKDALDAWAQENDIDDQYIHMGMGDRGGNGGGPREDM